MQAEIKVTEDGIFARRIWCGSWIRGAEKTRVANNISMKIAHWINPESKQIAFVFNRICMKMLCDPAQRNPGSTQFFSARSSNATSEWVLYNQPVIMFYQRWSNRTCYLLHPSGMVLSGSNTFGDGHSQSGSLCLGSNADPFNMSPVEALIHNEANRDLSWYGGRISGIWQDNTFVVSDWPCSNKKIWTPVRQIEENVNAWSHS